MLSYKFGCKKKAANDFFTSFILKNTTKTPGSRRFKHFMLT